MRKGAIILGIAMVVGGFIALFNGVVAMDAPICFVGDACDPNAGSGVWLFPVGLLGVILGCTLWSAGVGRARLVGDQESPLTFFGFFGIFGFSFFGMGAAMLLADQQPNVDHTTNVLTILGIVFGLVGIVCMGIDLGLRGSDARGEQLLATGLRGRATVTGVHDTGVTVNNDPMIGLDLRVEIPGQPVFTKTIRHLISRLEVGSYRPGMVLAIAADPAKPQEFEVDWAHSPVADATLGTDPVTGRPMDAATAIAAAGQAMPAGGATAAALSPAQIAAILNAAADQVAAGGGVGHPQVAAAVATSHGWTPGSGTMSSADMAAVLRTAAARVETGGTSAATLSSADLATLLRQASDAAGRAAAAAEAGTLTPAGMLPAPPALPSMPSAPASMGAPSIPPSILSGPPAGGSGGAGAPGSGLGSGGSSSGPSGGSAG